MVCFLVTSFPSLQIATIAGAVTDNSEYLYFYFSSFIKWGNFSLARLQFSNPWAISSENWYKVTRTRASHLRSRWETLVWDAGSLQDTTPALQPRHTESSCKWPGIGSDQVSCDLGGDVLHGWMYPSTDEISWMTWPDFVHDATKIRQPFTMGNI